MTADLLTSSLEEHLASRSLSLDNEEDWMTAVAIWPWNFADLLTLCAPDGSFGKTSRASSLPTGGGPLAAFSGKWRGSGMVSPGEYWTFSTSEWNHIREPSPSGGGVCSLSDILETGGHLSRYCLSPKACAGILRRAERRGKTLPEHLAAALRRMADSAPTSSAPEG